MGKKVYKCPNPQCGTMLVLPDSILGMVKCSKCSYTGALGTYIEVEMVKLDYECTECGNKWFKHHEKGEVRPDRYRCPKCFHEIIEDKTSLPDSSIDAIPFVLEMRNDADFVWYGNKRFFKLNKGINVIGRAAKNADPEVNIALPTKDYYMGRKHILINVELINETGHFKHVIVDNNSKNGTKLNGNEIPKGVQLILNKGDIITMGHTSFVLRPLAIDDM